MPCASSALGPTGEFISMRSPPSGPGHLCEHAMQRAPRQWYLEIVVAESARVFENRTGGCIVRLCVRRGGDQLLLRLRRSPGLMPQPAEREPGRAYPAARAIDDR